MLNSVNHYSRGCGLIAEEQALDGYARVIYILFSLCAHHISDLAAVSVDTVADAVDKLILFAVYLAGGKILYVLGYLDRLSYFAADIAQKVVTRADRAVVDLVFKLTLCGSVDEAVESSVAAANDDSAILLI